MLSSNIRLIELFGGIGSQAMALRDIGADFTHWRLVEFCKYAVASYNAIHGTNFEPVDIRDVKGKDLGIVNTKKFTYLLTYSFPCFTGNTWVMTSNGLKYIKDVKENDYVLTHTNTYKKVLASRKTGKKNIFQIKGMAFHELRCTENHKFYTRELYRKYPCYENGKRGNERHFKSPEWKECKDLSKNHYLGIAINKESKIPEWNGIDFKWKDRNRTEHSEILKPLMNNPDFWWIMGYYVGDGWERHQGGIELCGNQEKIDEVKYHLDKINLTYCINFERTCYRCSIGIKEISEFVKIFGKYAGGKVIPSEVLNLPVDLAKSFLDGYTRADGYKKNGKIKISSINENLIYSTAQLVAKVYQAPYSIYKTKRQKTTIIEGRVVNQKDTYELVWKTEKRKQDKAFYEDGYIWFPIHEVVNTNTIEDVYDIEVTGDHSFTANGAIAHNCQDLSLAGKQRGMTKGSGTRSGLLWEVERLLNETKNLPQILLMENVPQVHSTKNIDDFNKWIDFLESKGYSNFWQDLNAKDYGVAQNRKRCFMISILGNKTYEFPKPVGLNKCIKDYLEDYVDEKYYIKSEKARKLILDLQKRGIIEGKEKLAYTEKKISNKIGQISNEGSQCGTVVSDDGLFPTITAGTHGYANPHICTKSINPECINLYDEHGKETSFQDRIYRADKISPTITTSFRPNYAVEYADKGSKQATKKRGITTIKRKTKSSYRIRKLTPKECWRLMGFSDEDFEKAAKVNSNTQLYKQAGNSIVKDVLIAIFLQLNIKGLKPRNNVCERSRRMA